jgi:hypothetical protein
VRPIGQGGSAQGVQDASGLSSSNEPSHSFHQSNRGECLSCIATRSVVAVSLVFGPPPRAPCIRHTFQAGARQRCSSAFRVSVAPRCLLHEVDQVHGVFDTIRDILKKWG